MAGIKQVLGRIYKVMPKRHPDIYKTMQEYANTRGMKLEDLMATAATVYMQADATPDEKANLEEIMSRRAGSSGGSGGGSQKANFSMMTGMMKDFAGAMKDVFGAMNEARAGMSISALTSDFKATASALEEVKNIGSEGGSGSIGDTLADGIVKGVIQNITGGKLGNIQLSKRLGTGKVTKSPDDQVADKK